MTLTCSSTLADTIARIEGCEARYRIEAQKHLDSLTKPIGSLGRLEAVAAQIYSICAGRIPSPLRRGAYIFVADHGVTEEKVSAYPREVTAQMVYNYLRGGAAINVLTRLYETELTVVDVGIDAEFADAPEFHRAKVRRGSRNMRREPAMTREEVAAAIDVGIEQAKLARERGQHLVAVGEMGIGNTTAASAIAAMFTNLPIETLTGGGTGLDDTGKIRKARVIEESLELHFGDDHAAHEPIEILRCVGGLEIAAMTGFILGAASRRLAVLCDGIISTAAAAVAYKLAPEVKEYLIAGHCSEEPGHQHLLRYIGLTPILNLGMRLGEGTGAVLAIPLVEASARLFSEMATFASAGVSTKSE
jgi:nicotinate-nucleotide--dimethylbenzimidazole phosphoribosyltransferase